MSSLLYHVFDILGLPVIVPDEAESVLLGGGILAATAAGIYPTLQVRLLCGRCAFGETAAGFYLGKQLLGFI